MPNFKIKFYHRSVCIEKTVYVGFAMICSFKILYLLGLLSQNNRILGHIGGLGVDSSQKGETIAYPNIILGRIKERGKV